MFSRINFTLILLLCYSDFLLSQKNDVGNSYNKIANIVGDNFRECYSRNKAKIDGCTTQLWNEVFNLMKTGDSKLNIPKSGPVIIDQVRFDQKGTAVHLNGIFTNFTLTGMPNTVCTNVKVDTKSRTTTFNLTTPFINITSDFNLDGTFMMLPIKGQGKVAVNASGISIWGTYDVVQDGTGLRINNLNADFIPNDLSIKFIQADTDPIWDAINKLVSDNADALFNDMGPMVNKVMTDRMRLDTADVFKKLPAYAFIA